MNKLVIRASWSKLTEDTNDRLDPWFVSVVNKDIDARLERLLGRYRLRVFNSPLKNSLTAQASKQRGQTPKSGTTKPEESTRRENQGQIKSVPIPEKDAPSNNKIKQSQ